MLFMLLGVAGFIGVIVSFVLLIRSLLKKRARRKTAFILLSCFACMIIGVAFGPKSPENPVEVEPKETTIPTAPQDNSSDSKPSDNKTSITETNDSDDVGNASDKEDKSESADKVETVSFLVIEGQLGEYGKEYTLNAGTEFEELEIAYFIPAGTYEVTNLDTKSTAQVSVYCGEPELDGEWEYFVSDDNCANPIVLAVGEKKELVIKDGQFVVLSSDSNNIQFVMK